MCNFSSGNGQRADIYLLCHFALFPYSPIPNIYKKKYRRHDILLVDKHPLRLCVYLFLSDTDTDVCTECAIRRCYGLLPVYKCFARDVDSMDFASCGEVGY